MSVKQEYYQQLAKRDFARNEDDFSQLSDTQIAALQAYISGLQKGEELAKEFAAYCLKDEGHNLQNDGTWDQLFDTFIEHKTKTK